MRILGGFDVLLPDGRSAGPWGRPSARRAFQVLVLRERHRIGREELAELLFPELAPERAANGVSKALSMARSALAPFDVIKADRTTVWLDGEVSVDAEAQRRALRAALAMARGEARDAALVAGIEERGRLLDDELYSDWATASRDELDGLRASAMLTLARDRSAGHGRAGTWEVIRAWQQLLHVDRCSEEASSALIHAYAFAGMSDLVVRTFHRTVSALHELDLEPSADLRCSFDRARKAAPAGPRPSPPEALRGAIRTFGRDAALVELRDVIGVDHPGDCGAVLVSGPAGIGKSHLLDALGRELRAAGWLVVQAAADSDDRRAPLRALRHLLSKLDLSTAGPVVLEVAGAADGVTGDSPSGRRRLLSELVALFDSLAAVRPLVLMIDDLQWADAGLQEIVADLAKSTPSGRPWAVVLAARSDDDALTVVVPPSVRTMVLVPLAVEGIAALVRHTEPGLSEESVLRCASRSSGNPFFAMELARQRAETADDAADHPVPALIMKLLEVRMAGCSEDACQVLSLVALMGEEPSVEALLRFGGPLGLEPGSDSAIRAVDELVQVHLLDELADRVRLVHPLLRDAAVARLDPMRRAALHDVIAEHSAGELGARHRLAAFEASGLDAHAGAAAEAGFLLGHRARRLFADAAALDLFASGLRAFEAASGADWDELRPRAFEAWCQIGDVHLSREEQAEASQAYVAARALACSDDELARSSSAEAGLAYRVGDFDRCVSSYERGISSLRGPSPIPRARLEADLGWAYFRRGQPHESVALLERAVATLGDLGDALTRGHAFDRLATVLGVVGRAEEGLYVMERAFEAVGPTGDERELGVLHVHRATLYSELRRFGEALADAAAALRVGRASADRYHLAVVHWITGHIHEARGDLVSALAERDLELVLLEEVRNQRNAALAHAARSRLLRALGRAAESDEAAACARTLGDAQDDEAFSARVEDQLLVAGT